LIGNMLLSRYNLNRITAPGITLPPVHIFELPEKVLQFGTGVLLRGLTDYYIDKANRAGIFNGRIVVVKSTDTGTTAEFNRQDGLYTLHIKGIDDGIEVDEQIVCSAISRVLSAKAEWESVLKVAQSPQLQIVISNTTEVGVQLIQDNISKHPPVSFPGKLLAVLYERYKAFKGSADSGLVIIPTELIVNNGKKLEAIVLELAHLNKLEPAFMDWLEEHNHFCNSLVDRIVPGTPEQEQLDEAEKLNGYQDHLYIISEAYSLWAIEGNDKVAAALTFAQADQGIVIVPNIEIYRELKLRLLNGTHTLSCGVAFLSGLKTVRQAMQNAAFSQYINQLMLNEIAPAIPYQVDIEVAKDFAAKVLDRFRNPYINHQWISISAEYSSKIKSRVVPLLLNHYVQFKQVPECFALGFAAFIRFMKSEQDEVGNYTGNYNGEQYLITDSNAGVFHQAWKNMGIHELVNTILGDKNLWNTNLGELPGFRNAITKQLLQMQEEGSGRILMPQ
jgi:tagaturonate reductase